ncbi:MAG: hypothetical protein IKB36_03250 [Clostridia bacterium]|nr:hypothetical protein [Clostridia bacterium]
MNKKKYIVPSIVLIVSVILLVLTLMFTTTFIFCTGLNTFNAERIEKSMPVSEFAYKISPCYSNLRALYDSYDCFRYYDPYEENSTVNMVKAPEDYYKKCIEYSKKMYEYHSANPEAYKSNQNSNPSFDVAYFSQEQALIDARINYMVSLYLDGQKEEAQRVVNEYVNNLPDNKSLCAIAIMPFSNTVHDLENNVDYQKWMVEVEKKITKAMNEANPESEDKIENNFTRGAYYKPFDWQE